MKLNDILKGCDPDGVQDMGRFGNTEITAVSCDSRQAEPGGLFFAVAGHGADGHDYIGQAFEKGALSTVGVHMNRRPRFFDDQGIEAADHPFDDLRRVVRHRHRDEAAGFRAEGVVLQDGDDVPVVACAETDLNFPAR